MSYVYSDPSGLGFWVVPDGQTPAQAFNDIQQASGAQYSPILTYSVANTPAAQVVGGVAPPPPPNAPAPKQPKRLTNTYPKGFIISRPGESIPVDGLGDCPDGYAVDVTGSMCISLGGVVDTGGAPPVVASPATNVDLTINNSVALASGVGQAIGDAVNNDVQSAINSTDQAIQGVGSDIQATVDDTTSKVGSLVDGIVNSVKSALDWIWKLITTQIGNVIGLIKDSIGALVSTVSDAINNVIIPVARDIQQVIGEVNNVLNNTIAPIFNTIRDVYQQTSAAVTAIEKDLSGGLTGVLQLPSDLSNAFTSIQADIQRLNDTVFSTKDGKSSVFLSPDGNDSIWDRLSTIGKGVGILGNIDNETITYKKSVGLPEPDLSQAGAASISALGQEISAFVTNLVAGGRRTIDSLETSLTTLPLILGAEVGTFVGWWELIRSLDELFEPFYEFAKEDLKAKAGLSKLSVSDALSAWIRGIINDANLQEELAVNGWDAERIQVLKDLQNYLVDIDRSIDMWHRKVITDEELANNLRQHGVSGDQMAALKEQSAKLFNVELAAQVNRWGLIDDTALDAVLQENRYTDTEITAFKATMLNRESVEDVIARERRTILYAGLGNTPEGFASPSADTLAAATRDGIDAQTALDRWQQSFFILPLQEWIESYFRNLVTLGQLNSAMDFYRVPSQQRDLLINTRRALIPFRTIPTMLASGIIDEAYASQQLQAHGFDLVQTEALLKYGKIAHAASKVAASGDIMGISVATAKGYFDAGTIDADQYKQVLIAHGYSEGSAGLAVQVETQHTAMLARKQLASDIEAEVKAGSITIDNATALMDANKFSIAEKDKVLNRILTAKKQAKKIPSEAELHDMASHNAISIDMYKQGMVANGWQDPWLTAFIAWRFPSATTTAPA